MEGKANRKAKLVLLAGQDEVGSFNCRAKLKSEQQKEQRSSIIAEARLYYEILNYFDGSIS